MKTQIPKPVLQQRFIHPASARNHGGPVLKVPGLIPAGAGKTWVDRSERRAGWAHPRWCGENIIPCRLRIQSRGSSPLVRGKPIFLTSSRIRRGLIPAGAGKTVFPCCGLIHDPAHPRWCGENCIMLYDRSVSAGSSPLVRGKLQEQFFSLGSVRLIPAGAGKTRRSHERVCVGRAHPRWCGENARHSYCGSIICGSSPLVRGKLGF